MAVHENLNRFAKGKGIIRTKFHKFFLLVNDNNFRTGEYKISLLFVTARGGRSRIPLASFVSEPNHAGAIIHLSPEDNGSCKTIEVIQTPTQIRNAFNQVSSRPKIICLHDCSAKTHRQSVTLKEFTATAEKAICELAALLKNAKPEQPVTFKGHHVTGLAYHPQRT